MGRWVIGGLAVHVRALCCCAVRSWWTSSSGRDCFVVGVARKAKRGAVTANSGQVVVYRAEYPPRRMSRPWLFTCTPSWDGSDFHDGPKTATNHVLSGRIGRRRRSGQAMCRPKRVAHEEEVTIEPRVSPCVVRNGSPGRVAGSTGVDIVPVDSNPTGSRVVALGRQVGFPTFALLDNRSTTRELK